MIRESRKKLSLRSWDLRFQNLDFAFLFMIEKLSYQIMLYLEDKIRC